MEGISEKQQKLIDKMMFDFNGMKVPVNHSEQEYRRKKILKAEEEYQKYLENIHR